MNTPEIWIRGGLALSMDKDFTVYPECRIGVREGRIFHVSSGGEIPTGATVVDARGCLITPGLINGHTHVGMTLLRGIADDLALDEWLQRAIFPAERALGNPEFVRAGTELAIWEMIQGGTTCFNDMYYFQEHTAVTASRLGMRALCGQTVVEISGVQSPGELTAFFTEYVNGVATLPGIRPVIAPHSVYGVSKESWLVLGKLAEKLGVRLHTHLAETEGEVRDCQAKHGLSPVEFFESLGILGSHWVFAHATWLSDRDREILARWGAAVVHNPESNLKLRAGIAEIAKLRKAGVSVGLGTDGAASNNDLDLLGEGRTASFVSTLKAGPGELRARDVFAMATSEGARALGMEAVIGSLEVGKAADLITLQMDKAHVSPLYDPYSHLVYAARPSDVRDTMVHGRFLMRDRKLPGWDEPALRRRVTEWGARIAQELNLTTPKLD